MASQPNLIYVFADQLRYQALGYAGDARAATPNIDRFAEQGANLYNAVSNYPVCAPYRASLLTGKYPTSTGMVINELRMNPDQRCLGHILTEANYRTGYVGKWHLFANEFGNHDDPKNSFVPRGPHRLGFDGEWKAYGFQHVYYGAYYFTETPEKIFYGEGVYETDGQTDLAIDFVTRASKSKQPFALILSWGPPHDPWMPDNVPERFLRMFEDTAFPNPPNYRHEDDEPYADRWARPTAADREKLETWRRVYYAQTASVDWNFGRLLQAIDEAGMADNTIVVFTSDHGEMLGAQGRVAKAIFYEEACRVPMLIRWPGAIKEATQSDVCLSTVDILPTLAGLMNLDCPPDVEGMDLSHCLLGQPGPEPQAAFMQGTGAVAIWEDGHEWRALRDKRFTYAIYRVDGKELLFDHVNDPYQMINLADDPGHSRQLGRFRAQLKEKMADLKDTFEASTWYRDHWTDGDRRIIRSATRDFAE
jgi:arylsulfatase A-like enzyme